MRHTKLIAAATLLFASAAPALRAATVHEATKLAARPAEIRGMTPVAGGGVSPGVRTTIAGQPILWGGTAPRPGFGTRPGTAVGSHSTSGGTAVRQVTPRVTTTTPSGGTIQ